MAELLDWRRVQPEQAVRFVASMLRRGAVVALPTETSYVAAAGVLHPESLDRLTTLAGGAGLHLAVPSAAAARDWLPAFGRAGQRLTGRLWPGPLIVASAEGVEDGLLGRLSETARVRVFDGSLSLRQSAHPALAGVLAEFPEPLACAALPGRGGEAFTARQVFEESGDLDLILDDGPGRYSRPATVVVVAGEQWQVRTPGAVPADLLAREMARVIVFVCTGNTCRSPMAEAICKRLLADRLACGLDELPARGYRVLSAGLAAAPGMPAAAEAIAVARARGADLEQHQSQPLTPELAALADDLLVMTAGHFQALVEYWPEVARRAALLCPDGNDVADPIGQPAEVYQSCAAQLECYIEALLGRIAPSGRDPT